MSETETNRPSGVEAYHWKPWKIAGLVVSGLLVIAGGVLALVGETGADAPGAGETPVAAGGEGSTGPGRPDPDAAGGGGTESLLPGHTPPSREPGSTEPPDAEPPDAEPPLAEPREPEPAEAEPPASVPVDADGSVSWSPALLRGGFSFLVAFSVAFVLRAFMKIGVFFFGIWGASLFLLAQAGWIEVHWSQIDAAFEGWASGLADQFESFARFITGSLPSAGMAGLGLYTGIRRR